MTEIYSPTVWRLEVWNQCWQDPLSLTSPSLPLPASGEPGVVGLSNGSPSPHGLFCCVSVSWSPLLRGTPVIGSGPPLWSHLNLVTFAKILFPNKITVDKCWSYGFNISFWAPNSTPKNGVCNEESPTPVSLAADFPPRGRVAPSTPCALLAMVCACPLVWEPWEDMALQLFPLLLCPQYFEPCLSQHCPPVLHICGMAECTV